MREKCTSIMPRSCVNTEDVEFHASTIFSRRTHPWKNLTIDEARGVLVFEDLCQRFDYFQMRRQQGDQQRGLLVLDKTTRETSLQKLSREFRKAETRWGSLKNAIGALSNGAHFPA